MKILDHCTLSLLLYACTLPAAAGGLRLVPQVSDPGEFRSGIAFSPDGRTVAITGRGVTLWSASGYLLRRFGDSYRPFSQPEMNGRKESYTDDVTSVLFLKKGGELAAASRTDNTVRIYDTLTGVRTRSLSLRGRGAVQSMALSSDGGVLALGSTNGAIELLDLPSGRLLRELKAPNQQVTEVAFLPAGGIAAASMENTICRGTACGKSNFPDMARTITISTWDRDGNLLNSVRRTMTSSKLPFAVIPGSSELALITGDGLEIMDTKMKKIRKVSIQVSEAKEPEYSRIIFSPNSSLIAAAGRGATVFSWPELKKLFVYAPKDPYLQITDLAFNADSSLLGVTGPDGTELRMVESGVRYSRLERPCDHPRALAIAPLKPALATGNPIRLWDWTGAWLPDFNCSFYPGVIKDEQFVRHGKRPATLKTNKGTEVELNTMEDVVSAVMLAGDTPVLKATRLLFSGGGSTLYANSSAGYIRAINREGKVVSNIPAARNTPMALSKSGLFTHLWPVSGSGNSPDRPMVVVMNRDTGRLVYTPRLSPAWQNYVGIDDHGEYLAWGGSIWNLKEKSLEAELYGEVLDVSFDRRLAALRERSGEGLELSIMGWDGESLGSSRGRAVPWKARFYGDGGLAVGYGDGRVELRKVPGLELVKKLDGHHGVVTDMAVSSDQKYLVTTAEDNVVTIWNLSNYQSYSRVSSGDEWVIYTPDGYFDASPHGGSLLAMVDGLNAYPVDQFAALYNRPDLILERMGLGEPELLSRYLSLHLRRISSIGARAAEENLSNMPEGRITGVRSADGAATVDFVLSDENHQLRSCRIYVNDIPVFGRTGKEISGRRYAGSETIELSSGKNKIEVSAVNEAGVESPRASVFVDSNGKKGGQLYFLAFGVSKYKNPALNLSYADKDVKDLEAVVQKLRRYYDEVHIKTFLNSDVTAENIKAAKNFLQATQPRDTVVLFVAGHGAYDRGKDPRYYYLPFGADTNDLTTTGVEFDAVEDLLVGIGARNKLFLLDTCESGELDEDTFSRSYAEAGSRGIIPRTYRRPLAGRGTPSGSARGYLYRKDRYIYNNLDKRSGSIVLSSSRGGEMSYESHSLQNGIFTREILAAFTDRSADKNGDKKLSVDELSEYVSRKVPNLTGGLQHPSVDRDNIYQRMSFPSLAY